MKIEALFNNVDSDDYPDLVVESPQGIKYGPGIGESLPSDSPGGGTYNGYFSNPEIMTFNNPEPGEWKVWIDNRPGTTTANYSVKHSFN